MIMMMCKVIVESYLKKIQGLSKFKNNCEKIDKDEKF